MSKNTFLGSPDIHMPKVGGPEGTDSNASGLVSGLLRLRFRLRQAECASSTLDRPNGIPYHSPSQFFFGQTIQLVLGESVTTPDRPQLFP